MNSFAYLAVLLVALILAILAFRYFRRRLAQPYQPAVARIEGGGIKRGLTPPEGAVVLGRPLNISLTLVIFEMLRKGFLRQVAATPLTVEVAEAFRTQGSGLSAQARGDKRRQAAQAIRGTLHLYEEPFLEIIETNPGVPVHELDLGVAVQPLVRYVAGRVGGYDLEETRAYYRLIIERAPREARSDGRLTFERQQVFDRNFGWVLLGEDFGSVLDQPDYSYVPVWQREQGSIGAEEHGSDFSPHHPGSLTPMPTFAAWAKGVMASMEGAVNEADVKLKLGGETDTVTATLMSDIGRATFYG
ncbi:MAG: hypothetical protein WEC16_01790 [Anaerolineales bacterium]